MQHHAWSRTLIRRFAPPSPGGRRKIARKPTPRAAGAPFRNNSKIYEDRAFADVGFSRCVHRRPVRPDHAGADDPADADPTGAAAERTGVGADGFRQWP